MSDLALQLIRKEKEARTGKLDLGYCGLGSLPDELFDCVWLEELYLCNAYWDYEKREWVHSENEGNTFNMVFEIPDKIARLKNLKILYANGGRTKYGFSIDYQISDISVLQSLSELHTLYLRSNEISDISILKDLSQLHTLDLSWNEISDISILKDLSELHTLYLRSNEISDISILKDLSQLHTLDLSSNEISDISILKDLSQLHTLYLNSNQISDYSVLKSLSQLHTLDLGYNHISDISVLKSLSQLQTLDLRSNQISDYSVLKSLSQLQTLDLRSNQISDISVLKSLSQLHTLDLRYNQISDISVLKSLSQLHTLDLSYNQISDISVLKSLSQLQTLDLRYNQISDISVLKSLSQLQTLDLSYNQISDISVLKSLSQLQTLDLSSNKDIKDYSVLKSLSQLHTLYLNSNQISDISVLQSLTQLRTLDIQKNKIVKLPNWITDRQFEISTKEIEWYLANGKMALYGNPLESPPIETIEKGKAAIRRYFEELEEEGESKIYEAKMLLVGEAKVGKTSLYKRLENRQCQLPEDSERTRGIDIHQHRFKGKHGDDFIINIWDFGGQDILHATHRFFLTARSLYVLLTATDMNDDNFDYWIPNIHLFGDKSPVLVVKNIKSGFNRNFSIHRFMDKGFNLPRQMMEVNLKSCEGFEALETAIQEHIQQLPQIGQPLPKSWVRVRHALLEIAKKKPYFSYEEFKTLANKEGIETDLKVQDVGDFLHEMGVILWYRGIPALKSKVILQPVWATNAVYQIVDDSNVGADRGRFGRKDVERLWTEASYQNMQDELLALMQAFRLCYKKRGKEEYIIPSLLPADPVALHWQAKDDLKLQYKYDFMPKGIINQLTAQMHDLLRDEDSVWSRGMVLEDGTTQALVKQDYYKRELTIQCQGQDARALMRMVMRDLDLIHASYGGISFKRRVPCTCSECKESIEPYVFEYEKLERKVTEGKDRVPCFESEEFVSIGDILHNIGMAVRYTGKYVSEGKSHEVNMLVSRAEEQNMIKKLRVFISYSKHDKSYLEDLRVSLRPYERKSQLEVWFDGEIEAGMEWDAEIKENLQSADIILLLVSRDFINTDYIWDVEMKRAMERHEKGEAVVIPIIIRPCLWTGDIAPFSKLNALPAKGKAISAWEDVDNAWVNVEEGLKKVIESRL